MMISLPPRPSNELWPMATPGCPVEPVKPVALKVSAKSLPTAEMEKLIVANTAVTQDALSALATRRAETVRKYLETKGQIPLERIFLIAPKLTADGIKDKGQPNRVDFALK